MTATAVGFQADEPVICSDAMRKIMRMAERIARGSAAILITGETGSGKELMARFVHKNSLRCGKPFVDINCAAFPEHLVESELFGYDKGAFSGADKTKPGLFEMAHTGTLFLDEVGELDPKVQVKLLRVLDGAPYYRLGGSHKVAVDVRILAATNKRLDEAVRDGRFRRDLLHRLGQIQLKIPPLRERPEDISAIANYFLQQQRPGARWTQEALEILQKHPWPGNVRELRNVVVHASSLSDSMELTPKDLPEEVTGCGPVAGPPPRAAKSLEDTERDAILHALSMSGGHHRLAAGHLGISTRTLSRKLKQYRIEAEANGKGAGLGVLSDGEQQYFRAGIRVPVEITRGTSKATVITANVSAGGIAVEGFSNVFEYAKPFTLRMSLPGMTVGIETEGRLVWADVGGKAGIHFISLPADVQRELKAWLLRRQREEGWVIRE